MKAIDRFRSISDISRLISIDYNRFLSSIENIDLLRPDIIGAR